MNWIGWNRLPGFLVCVNNYPVYCIVCIEVPVISIILKQGIIDIPGVSIVYCFL